MILSAKNLSKGFDLKRGPHTAVFESFNLRVEFSKACRVVAICGPSGCGKTTLLRLLGGTQIPDEGSISVSDGGHPLTTKDVATVPQRNGCFPWLSAAENVEYGLRVRHEPFHSRRQRAMQLLNRVGLAESATAYPAALSGGMNQRVSLARALVVKPRLLLLDEPFAALDPATKRDIQSLTSQLIEEEESSTILVTHDLTEALLLADRIIVLPAKPVRVTLQDSLVSFRRPRGHDIVYSDEFRNALRILDASLSSALNAARL